MTKHHKKNILRNCVSIALSFVLCIIFTGFFCVVGLQTGAFSKDMTLEKINESDYYNKAYNELTNNIDTILEGKGYPKGIADIVITDKRVYINGKQYIQNSLDGKNTKISVTKIHQELTDLLNAYYITKGIVVDDNIKNHITGTVNSIETEYIRMIRFQFVDYIRSYKKAYYSVLQWGLPIAFVLTVILVVILLRLHKYVHRGIRYIALSILSAAGITALLPLLMLFQGAYKMSIKPVYYANFLTEYLKWSLTCFVYVGFVGAMISIGLFVWIHFLKNKIK